MARQDRARRGEILVVAGKGGVGKTSVSAILARLLLARVEKLLVIDADPVVSVTYALGESPGRTIGDFREELIEDPRRSQRVADRPTREIIRDLVRRSPRGFDFLAMGRAEGKGCFCGVNDLLRFGIQAVCSEYDLSLIDCEAGIEQVNRRTVHRIDHLLLVADSSRRAMETLVQVRDLAVKYNEGKPLRELVLLNRVRQGEEEAHAREVAVEMGLAPASACIPDDPDVTRYNAQGWTLFDLPDDSAAVRTLETVVEDLLPGLPR